MASASAVRLSPSVEKQKLKLELLRGSRLKLESLPVSVVVHEHLVRAGCMFFGTTTRRTLTRLHRWSDLICSDQTRSGLERVQPCRAPAAEIGDRKQSDSYTDMYACAPLSVSVTTQNGGRTLDVLPATRRFDFGSKQSSTKLLLPFSGIKTPHRWPPKDRPGPALPQGRYSLTLLSVYSHI